MPASGRGRAKPGAIDKPWKDALALALNEPAEDGRKKLRAVADACVNAAIAGDVSAMKEIGDRMDGRSKETKEISVEHRTVARIPVPAATPQEWAEQHAPVPAVH